MTPHSFSRRLRASRKAILATTLLTLASLLTYWAAVGERNADGEEQGVQLELPSLAATPVISSNVEQTPAFDGGTDQAF